MSTKKDEFEIKKIGINSFLINFDKKKLLFEFYVSDKLTIIKYSTGTCCGNNWCLTYQNDGYLINSSNKFDIIRCLITRKLANGIKRGIECPLEAILTLPYS